jgi:hypothetical protein
MKITIEHERQVCEVNNPEAVTITDALELMERALYGIGFVFKGSLEIAPEEKDTDLDD